MFQISHLSALRKVRPARDGVLLILLKAPTTWQPPSPNNGVLMRGVMTAATSSQRGSLSLEGDLCRYKEIGSNTIDTTPRQVFNGNRTAQEKMKGCPGWLLSTGSVISPVGLDINVNWSKMGPSSVENLWKRKNCGSRGSFLWRERRCLLFSSVAPNSSEMRCNLLKYHVTLQKNLDHLRNLQSSLKQCGGIISGIAWRLEDPWLSQQWGFKHRQDLFYRKKTQQKV